MRIGKYEITDVTKYYDNESYMWIPILPNLEIRHKYFYLWEIQFSWFNYYKRVQICKSY